jgi:hypothetical protein
VHSTFQLFPANIEKQRWQFTQAYGALKKPLYGSRESLLKGATNFQNHFVRLSG